MLNLWIDQNSCLNLTILQGKYLIADTLKLMQQILLILKAVCYTVASLNFFPTKFAVIGNFKTDIFWYKLFIFIINWLDDSFF